MKTIAFLFFWNICFGQSYEYKEVFLRDFRGEFSVIGKSGKLQITDSEIHLFDQVLIVKSKHIIFDEKGKQVGFLYSCQDSKNWYTLLLTNDLTLYFKDKEREVFRIKLESTKN